MKLSIIRDMGLVHVDGEGYDKLDMSDVPADVHALQWNGESGEIEYISNEIPNTSITSLPDWADLAKAKKDAKDAEEAAEKAAQEASDLAHYNSAEGQKERIAAKRFEKETAGITVSNMQIATDRESQALITGAVTAFQLDPNTSITWKLGNGRATVNQAQMEAIATAVRVHVQTCFDREFALIDAVDAGTFTDAMLEQGWPA